MHCEHIDDVDQVEGQVNEMMKARDLQDADVKINGKTREWRFGENCGVQRREFGGPCVKASVSPRVDGFCGTNPVRGKPTRGARKDPDLDCADYLKDELRGSCDVGIDGNLHRR